MQKHIGYSFAAVGMVAALVVPSAYAGQSRNYRDDRADKSALSVSQIVDRADARIAELKANLRLSAEQAKHWPALQTALRDIATKRADMMADNGAPRTGRSSAESSNAAARPVADEEADVTARKEQAAQTNPRPDDITAMQHEADALAAQSANLRQISDAAKPLYDSLDDHQRRLLVQFVHNDIRADQRDDSRERR
jgi:hypothetical protein